MDVFKDKIMKMLIHQLCTVLDQGQAAVLGTIVASSGSAPRSSGTRMLYCRDGRLFGTIGGGELEGRCISRARELLEDGPGHELLRFDLTADLAAAEGMICGGAVQILLQRLEPEAETMKFFQTLADAYARGRSPALLTMVSDNLPPRLLMHIPGSPFLPDLPPEFLNDALRLASKSGRPATLASGGRKLHIETMTRPLRLHLAGAGHVALATAHLAGFLGYEVNVLDDRPEFANRQRFPDAGEVKVISSFAHCLGRLAADDYLVIVTRGHLHDQEVLAQALRTDAGYIGMIGSRRKRDAIYEALRRQGFSDLDLSRVHSPIGLPIGGESPEEIALSIMAEIQQFRYGKAI